MLQPRDLAKLAYLYLHQGRWNDRQVVPAEWVTQSTTDHVADPLHDYGYLWWLDCAAVVTAHLPATVDATAVTRWLLEKYILPAAG
jgi:CubicO group peptidase (beta-lactamase class C family)